MFGNKFKILQNSKMNKFRPLNNHQSDLNGTGGIYRDFQKKILGQQHFYMPIS